MLQRCQRQSKENQMGGGKRPVLAGPIGSHRATKPTRCCIRARSAFAERYILMETSSAAVLSVGHSRQKA